MCFSIALLCQSAILNPHSSNRQLNVKVGASLTLRLGLTNALGAIVPAVVVVDASAGCLRPWRYRVPTHSRCTCKITLQATQRGRKEGENCCVCSTDGHFLHWPPYPRTDDHHGADSRAGVDGWLSIQAKDVSSVSSLGRGILYLFGTQSGVEVRVCFEILNSYMQWQNTVSLLFSTLFYNL